MFLVCPPLPPLDNGDIFPPTLVDQPSAIGSVATYTCDSQYYLDGIGNPPEQTCTQAVPNPTWLPAAIPTCLQGQCYFCKHNAKKRLWNNSKPKKRDDVTKNICNFLWPLSLFRQKIF